MPLFRDRASRITHHVSRLNPVRLDLVVKRLAADAEAFGGFQLVAAGFLEHLDNRVALDSLQQREVGILRLITGALGLGDREIGAIHFVAFR